MKFMSKPAKPARQSPMTGPGEPCGPPHVEIGTEIEIPNNKLKWDKPNPTGHGDQFGRSLSSPTTAVLLQIWRFRLVKFVPSGQIGLVRLGIRKCRLRSNIKIGEE